MDKEYSENRIKELEAELDEKNRLIEDYSRQIEDKEAEICYLDNSLNNMIRRYKKASADFIEIKNSSSWRITKPLRDIVTALRKSIKALKDIVSMRAHLSKPLNIIKIFFTAGPKQALYEYEKSMKEDPVQKLQDLGFDVKAEELRFQRGAKFEKDIKISIITPLYNTPAKYLKAMIGSAEYQTYANWELCLADGSDSRHAYVQRMCEKYCKKDSRIKYKKLDKNLGISGNSNACIEMAQGEYLALLDHDDVLHPYALYEVMEAICEKNADFIYTDENTFRSIPRDAYNPNFKPDFAPDSLCGNNYICHLSVFKRTLIDQVGAFDPEFDGAQDHDLILRLTEKAEQIVHIPKILYFWRAHRKSVAEKTEIKHYVFAAGTKAVESHFERTGCEGHAAAVRSDLTIYRVQYELKETPKVSIIIPNYEHIKDLKTCLNSVFSKSSYSNFEIVIIENNSRSKELFDYYEQLKAEHGNLKVITWDGKFNYSAINNFGVKNCSGEYILLLNNDTEVITPDWIEQMLMYAQRDDVGAVGAKLYYLDDTVQHAGIGLGILGLAGHFFRGFDRDDLGYMGRLLYAQDLSAVTGACLMVRRDVWEKVSGLDESFEIAFNDVDLCLRIRKAGYLIVWTPFAELYHYESKSRGSDDTDEDTKRFEMELSRFTTRWEKELASGDPYYNPNLSLDSENFAVKQE